MDILVLSQELFVYSHLAYPFALFYYSLDFYMMTRIWTSYVFTNSSFYVHIRCSAGSYIRIVFVPYV